MANTYHQQYEAFGNPDVRGMVDFAAIKAGNDILQSGGDPATARMQLAEAIAGAPNVADYSLTPRNRAITALVVAVVTNPTILASMYPGGVLTPGDASANDLDFVIASEWDAVAASVMPAQGVIP